MSQIFYNGTVLAPGGITGEPFDLHLPQKVITEVANFFRSAANSFFPRGNLSSEFAFKVHRQFGDIKSADVFVATHANSLAGQGNIVWLVGDPVPGTQQLNLQNATFDGAVFTPQGVDVVVEYKFSGGAWDTEDIAIPDSSDIVKHFSYSLTIGQTSQAVVFGTPFGTSPTAVTAHIASPSGGYGITCWPDWSTLTASGVTFQFGASIPATGYTLEGDAVL